MRTLLVSTIGFLALGLPSCSCTEDFASPRELVSRVKILFGQIRITADSVTDVSSAKVANTTITNLVGKVSGLIVLTERLPSGAGSKILRIVQDQAGPQLRTLTGLAPNLREHVGGAITELTELTKPVQVQLVR